VKGTARGLMGLPERDVKSNIQAIGILLSVRRMRFIGRARI
jgi:hypothetical protein